MQPPTSDALAVIEELKEVLIELRVLSDRVTQRADELIAYVEQTRKDSKSCLKN